ncbi:hypothetical protein [Arthrobacter cheniae]|nr:hypothetical protein [Arthrobacter cheniae]
MTPRILSAPMLGSLVQLLDDGNYVVTACRYIGISEASYYSWLDRARVEVDRVDGLGFDAQAIISTSVAGKTLGEMIDSCPPEFEPKEWTFVVFAAATTRARGQAVARAVKAVKTAAMNGDWRAAAWYLEHAHGREFGRGSEGVEATPEGLASEAVSVDALEAKLMSLMEGKG